MDIGWWVKWLFCILIKKKFLSTNNNNRKHSLRIVNE